MLHEERKDNDWVFGDLSVCGRGGFAEYVCARENALVVKPTRLSFEEAAAVPMAAVTALQGLREKGQIKPGQKVLIHGASGGVGTFAVQIAKAFGAEVTAVWSTRNVDMAHSLGADHVIDYTRADFTTNGETYDVIFDVVGKSSFTLSVRSLKHNGRYPLEHIVEAHRYVDTGHKKGNVVIMVKQNSSPQQNAGVDS